jgi:hypothetical protein
MRVLRGRSERRNKSRRASSAAAITSRNAAFITGASPQPLGTRTGGGSIDPYYDIGDARQAAWSYRQAYAEVGRISDFVSFEPDIVSVQIDGMLIHLEPGQTVIPHGPDRDLTVTEALPRNLP